MQPLPRPTSTSLYATAGAVILLALVPLAADRFTLVLLGDIMVFALFAASLGLLMGPGGITSFGHAAYLGAGAYAAALAAKAGMPFPVAIIAGVVLAGLLALLLGAVAVRLEGVSLAMLTLAFAQIVWAIVFQWDAVTGGSNGLVGVWPPALLAEKPAYYIFTLAMVAAGLMAIWWVVYTPFGYRLRAARDAPTRAEALGIHTRAVRWAAFGISGTLAGLGGAVYVFSKGSLSPDVVAIPRSVDALVMVLLGGVNTISGPIAGAAVFTWLADTITRLVPYWQAMLGASIITLVLLFPEGMVGTARRRLAKRGALR